MAERRSARGSSHDAVNMGDLLRLLLCAASMLSSMTPPVVDVIRSAPTSASSSDLFTNVSCCPKNLLTCVSSPSHAAYASIVVVHRATDRPLRFMLAQPSRPLALVAFQVLLQAGDIEANPGPGSSASMCPVCDKKFGKKSKTLMCVGCDEQIHFMCQAVTGSETGAPPKAGKGLRMCPHCAHCQSNYPCMSCNQGVTWSGKNSKALQCDGCDHWMHIHCTGVQIGETTYNGLTDSSNLWLCPDCGLPNNTELIYSYDVSVRNSFSVLNQDFSLDTLI